MKKERNKEVKVFLMRFILVFITLLLISTVSAEGFWGWFKKTITGKASTTGTYDASVTITGTNPLSNIKVFNATLTGSAVTPSESGILNLSFNVSITDVDGADDINDSSVKAKFTFGSFDTKQNTTECSEISGEGNSSTQNYSCSIQMAYFDAPGAWQINVSAKDLGAGTPQENSSMNFSYAALQGIVIGPATISWPSTNPGNTNVCSTYNTTINNTGNYNCTNISVQGIHLYGSTGDFLDIGNFTVNHTTSTTDICDIGLTLVNGSDQQLVIANVTAGNVTINDGTIGQEVIRYCINEVPTGLPSQTYSTSEVGSKSWTITMNT